MGNTLESGENEEDASDETQSGDVSPEDTTSSLSEEFDYGKLAAEIVKSDDFGKTIQKHTNKITSDVRNTQAEQGTQLERMRKKIDAGQSFGAAQQEVLNEDIQADYLSRTSGGNEDAGEASGDPSSSDSSPTIDILQAFEDAKHKLALNPDDFDFADNFIKENPNATQNEVKNAVGRYIAKLPKQAVRASDAINTNQSLEISNDTDSADLRSEYEALTKDPVANKDKMDEVEAILDSRGEWDH